MDLTLLAPAIGQDKKFWCTPPDKFEGGTERKNKKERKEKVKKKKSKQTHLSKKKKKKDM